MTCCRAEALAAAVESSEQNKDEADSGNVSTVTQVGDKLRTVQYVDVFVNFITICTYG